MSRMEGVPWGGALPYQQVISDRVLSLRPWSTPGSTLEPSSCLPQRRPAESPSALQSFTPSSPHKRGWGVGIEDRRLPQYLASRVDARLEILCSRLRATANSLWEC